MLTASELIEPGGVVGGRQLRGCSYLAPPRQRISPLPRSCSSVGLHQQIG